MKFWRNAGLFAGAWVAAMLAYTLLYQVKQPVYILTYTLIPALFFIGVALLATAANKKIQPAGRIHIWILLILLGLDQVIKIYLFQQNWQTINVPLVEPVFYFSPSHNQSGSYLWHLLGLQREIIWPHVIFVFITLFVIISYWHFYRERRKVSFWSSGAIHLILAGVLANLTDNIFHGGSLDFITINPFYVFDIKDAYITTAMLFVITESVEQKGQDHQPLKGFSIKYVIHDIKGWFRRKKS
ncbi:MAG: signal peptidase II [Candidatus Cyclobacteriaceae bacterium M3_2C_046]